MNKTYAITDLHGMYHLWCQIRDYCDDTDTIYFLGDAIDRGPDGIKIVKELLTDKRVIYLKGNHEELMLDAIPPYIRALDGCCDRTNDEEFLWLYNGGQKTLEDFCQESEKWKEQIYFNLQKLKDHIIYENKNGQKIYLCHSGTCFDWKGYWWASKYRHLNHYTWDRKHFYREWDGKDNEYMIHGHTPVHYLFDEIKDSVILIEGRQKFDTLRYCNGHKIDLDLFSIESKRAVLFDLDTLQEEKYFESPEGEINE